MKRAPTAHPVIFLLLAACGVDNQLGGEKDGTKPFDTASTTPLDTSETDTDDTDDTGTTTTSACLDRSYPGEALPILDECLGSDPITSWDSEVVWNNTATGDSYTSAVVGQLTDDNGDGVLDDLDTPDIVSGSVYDGIYTAVSGDDGRVLWTYADRLLGTDPMTPAIGDIDGDGWNEVVAGGSGGIHSSIGAVIALNGVDGSLMWTADPPSTVYCQDGAVTLGDLDGDGQPEVVVGALILDGATGAKRGEGVHGTGSGWAGGIVAPISAIADIDQDGVSEVVTGNALYDADGNTIWYNDRPDGFVAVGQFDSDPQGEIVVSANGLVRLLDDDGTQLWTTNYFSRVASGPPTVADFDGDGDAEIGVAGYYEYIVLERDGTEKWRQTISDESSGIATATAFDFNRDGAAEIVYGDEWSIFIFDGSTGEVLLDEPVYSNGTATNGPVIADVNNDGHADIVYTNSRQNGQPETGMAVRRDVGNNWPPARPIWNQNAYAITHVEDDGAIPAVAASNWLVNNSFRGADVEAWTDEGQVDLLGRIVELCFDDCPSDQVWVWFALGNQGGGDQRGTVYVEFWAHTATAEVLVGTYAWSAPIPAGEMSEAVSLRLFDLPATPFDLEMRIDPGGDVTECYEDNNGDWREGVTCP